MMASSTQKESEIKEILDGAHNKFIRGLLADIKNSKTIEKKWQNMYITNCLQLRDELYQYQFEFIEGTLKKIEQVLCLSEENVSERQEIYSKFQMVFDEIAVRCLHVDNQMKTILKALCALDVSFNTKYGIFLGAGIGTAVVGSAIGAVLVAHALPATICSFTLVGAVCPPLLIGGAVAMLVSSSFFLYKAYTASTSVQEARVKKETHSFVHNWAALCFPAFAKLGPHDQCTDEEIEKKFHKILCTMKSDEDVWLSNGKLETLKESLEKNSIQLKQERNRVEEQDRMILSTDSNCNQAATGCVIS